MKRFIATLILFGLVLGLINIATALPPPPPRPGHPHWIPPPARYWGPPPAWRVPPYSPRPWIAPRLWIRPRPPLPWYWAPPPPAIKNWWFWVWWRPIPVSIYYSTPAPSYYYEYYSYPYPESGEPEYLKYSEEFTRYTPGTPPINSPEDYERWLIQTLNLTEEQQQQFFPKLQMLAQLREQFINTRTVLNSDIEKIQQTDDSALLEKKTKEFQKAESKFRKKEKKLINEMMSLLTEEQKTKFIAEMNKYTQTSEKNKKQ